LAPYFPSFFEITANYSVCQVLAAANAALVLKQYYIINTTYAHFLVQPGSNYYFAAPAFGLFAPYLERPCILLATPEASSVPLMI
jgi:hypothetical protein